MPIEKLVSVAFYRGLTMSLSVERDQHGRTDYSMMAVNASRVMKGSKSSSLLARSDRTECEVAADPANRI